VPCEVTFWLQRWWLLGGGGGGSLGGPTAGQDAGEGVRETVRSDGPEGSGMKSLTTEAGGFETLDHGGLS